MLESQHKIGRDGCRFSVDIDIRGAIRVPPRRMRKQCNMVYPPGKRWTEKSAPCPPSQADSTISRSRISQRGLSDSMRKGASSCRMGLRALKYPVVILEWMDFLRWYGILVVELSRWHLQYISGKLLWTWENVPEIKYFISEFRATQVYSGR